MNLPDSSIQALDHQIHGHFCLNLKTGEIEFERYDPCKFKLVKVNLQDYIDEYRQEASKQ
jgi:hypothetical protein